MKPRKIERIPREICVHGHNLWHHGWARTDHESFCTELGLTMRVDSSG